MNLKEQVGIKSIDFVEEGMYVGLGTGSTAYYMIEELGRRVAKGLNVIGVATSEQTRIHAASLGIPLKPLNEVPYIDVTIDGADEFDKNLWGIKGGGAAHLFEKIVAIQSKKNIWIVDASKKVDRLGKFPLPVEVIPFGSQLLFTEFAVKGYRPQWRMHNNEKLRTDSNNFVIDLHMGIIHNPKALALELDQMSGVVEHGLFIDIADMVIVSNETGVEILHKP